MKNIIKQLEIRNFKSIREIDLVCNRVNLIIGEPNVGKSNILEAISLYSSQYSTNDSQALSEFVRYEKIKDLFYDHDLNLNIQVNSNLGFVSLAYQYNVDTYILSVSEDKGLNELFENKNGNRIKDLFINCINSAEYLDKRKSNINPLLKVLGNTGQVKDYEFDKVSPSPVKKYVFKDIQNIGNPFHLYLYPPFGENLLTILQANRKFADEVSDYFKKFGFELVLNIDDHKILLQKRISNIVHQFSYYLVADTLRRIIFHLAAIETNKDSVILFEEPESHLFPPYISRLAEKISEDKYNQYFISTHNPYLFNTLIENTKNEVSVFYVYYDDYQTKIKKISDAELDDLFSHGADVFYNFNWINEA